jgi:hypothetical protein
MYSSATSLHSSRILSVAPFFWRLLFAQPSGWSAYLTYVILEASISNYHYPLSISSCSVALLNLRYTAKGGSFIFYPPFHAHIRYVSPAYAQLSHLWRLFDCRNPLRSSSRKIGTFGALGCLIAAPKNSPEKTQQ